MVLTFCSSLSFCFSSFSSAFKARRSFFSCFCSSSSASFLTRRRFFFGLT